MKKTIANNQVLRVGLWAAYTAKSPEGVRFARWTHSRGIRALVRARNQGARSWVEDLVGLIGFAQGERGAERGGCSHREADRQRDEAHQDGVALRIVVRELVADVVVRDGHVAIVVLHARKLRLQQRAVACARSQGV